MSRYRESLELARENATIFDSLVKAESALNSDEYNNICISISGGADSDIVLDICSRVTDRDLKYVFFDTCLELGATKEHLGELEEKYGITIERCEPRIPVARVVRQYGVPFLSKFVSEQIKRLQSRDFDFVDKSYKRHYNQYWDVSSSLKWFYNEYTTNGIERNPRFRGNIGYNKYLREFLIEHPPDFSISNECCNFAKKLPAIDYAEENEVDLELLGIRKAEGGESTHLQVLLSGKRKRISGKILPDILVYESRQSRLRADLRSGAFAMLYRVRNDQDWVCWLSVQY